EGPTSRWAFEDRPYLLPNYDRGYQDGVADARLRRPDRPDTIGPETRTRKQVKKDIKRTREIEKDRKEFKKFFTGQDDEDPHGHEEHEPDEPAPPPPRGIIRPPVGD